MIKVGAAGWSYADWEGIVYPRAKPYGFHPLAYLMRFLACSEVNASFYALPRREHAARWAQLAAGEPEFRFLVKLHRDFTHGPPEGATGDLQAKAQAFRAGIEPLHRARKLGALLMQFPVSFLHGAAEVRRLGRLAELFAGFPLAVELRHASWFDPPALDAVRGLSLSLLHIDLPAAWNHPPQWHAPTGPIGYLRLHGRNAGAWFRRNAGRDERYDYLYSPAELERLADKARRLAEVHEDVYVIANNHFAGQAVANALELSALLSGARVPAPPELVERYPRLARSTRVEGQQRLF